MSEHCTREEIQSGARRGRLSRAAARSHVETCTQCRTLWELACHFAGAASVRLDPAPSGWVERAIAIASSRTPARRLGELAAKLIFDSWHAPAVEGLRSTGSLESRRLAWDAGKWHIDLRAEATADGWDMVAQVQYDNAAAPGQELQFNSDPVYTDATGMAMWHGRRPPRKIALVTPDGTWRLESVTWSRPKKS